MGLPAQVQIGPYRFKVVSEPNTHAKYEAKERQSVYGCIQWAPETILVDPELQGERAHVTLLHEVLHGCIDIAAPGNKDEERIVTALAPMLLDTLRRNPELVAYLLGD